MKGLWQDPEWRSRIVASMKEKPPISEETKRKMRKALSGRTLSKDHRRKIAEANTGKTHSEETKRKISKAKKGQKATAESRRINSEAHKGVPKSAEHRRRIGEAKKGELHWNWRGGTSFEPYGPDFNGTLKGAIRERDGYACQLCSIPENGSAHDCHHVDYRKENNRPDNLTTLCHGCHSKTNRNRGFYICLFQAHLKLKKRRQDVTTT